MTFFTSRHHHHETGGTSLARRLTSVARSPGPRTFVLLSMRGTFRHTSDERLTVRRTVVNEAN